MCDTTGRCDQPIRPADTTGRYDQPIRPADTKKRHRPSCWSIQNHVYCWETIADTKECRSNNLQPQIITKTNIHRAASNNAKNTVQNVDLVFSRPQTLQSEMSSTANKSQQQSREVATCHQSETPNPIQRNPKPQNILDFNNAIIASCQASA